MKIFCNYGCGQEAKYQFKNGKWCCESNTSKCPEIRKKNSLRQKGRTTWNKGKYLSEEHKQKCGWNKGLTKNCDTRILKQSISLKKTWSKKEHYFNSQEYRQKLKESQNRPKVKKKKAIDHKFTIKKIKEKHPFFAKVEEMRYNPDKPGEREIQVHCKNHNCPNSKEQNGWFTPTRTQLHERIRNLENPLGTEGSYFYCSEKCKNECPLYNLHSDPFKKNKKRYTSEEYQTFRQFVLERDNFQCQYCGKKAYYVHHIRPQKLEPFFALDPDYAISVCKDCHYKYGHKDECNTGELASKVCT